MFWKLGHFVMIWPYQMLKTSTIRILLFADFIFRNAKKDIQKYYNISAEWENWHSKDSEFLPNQFISRLFNADVDHKHFDPVILKLNFFKI